MEHRSSGNPDDQAREPVYMGKTLAVMGYTFSVVMLLLAAGFGWVASYLHANGYQRAGIAPGWSFGVVITGATGGLFFLLFVFTTIAPALREEFPVFKRDSPENRASTERSWRRNFDKEWRRKAFQNAPMRKQRLIRVCQWSPLLLFLVWLVMSICLQLGLAPVFLIRVERLLLNTIGHYGPLLPYFAIVLPISLYKIKLEHGVFNAYERQLKRTETNASHCPECDYPIDRESGMRVCPECGHELNVVD